jgi:hypothetical protein
MLSIFPSHVPSRPTLVYSTPWDSPVRGPAPSSISGSLHYAVLLPALYSRLIATVFWGAGNSAQGPLPSLELPGVLLGKSAIGSTTAPAVADPPRAPPRPSSLGLQPQFQAPLPPSPSLAIVSCTVSTVQFALFSTTASTLEPLLIAFPNCPPFSVADREKSGGRQEKAGIAARKGHKSGGRQEMRGQSGANPETPHIRLVLCWFPAEKPGVCWGQTGNSRKRREIAGKRGRRLGKLSKGVLG